MELHRQQRKLQALRVRTYCYKLAFVTLVVMAASGRYKDLEVNQLA